MSNSTITFDSISSSQASKEVTANAYLDAVSPASLFGRRASTSAALTWGYYGGNINVDGVLTQISNDTIALSGASTNYVEATRAGVVSKNTTAFSAGSIPLYVISTNTTTVMSYTDYRMWVCLPGVSQRLALAMSDANTTLSSAQAKCSILEFTGSLGAGRNIVVPLAAQQWTVYNNTTGGFALTFIGATGTGIAVAATKRAIVYSDGTNVVRVTADT